MSRSRADVGSKGFPVVGLCSATPQLSQSRRLHQHRRAERDGEISPHPSHQEQQDLKTASIMIGRFQQLCTVGKAEFEREALRPKWAERNMV